MMPPLPQLPEPASGAQYDLHTLNRYDERTLRAWARAYGLAVAETCAQISDKRDFADNGPSSMAARRIAAAIRAMASAAKPE